VLLGGPDILTLSFDDVSSGYNGENPRGNLTAGALIVPVTCLNVTGNQRFTVGVVSDGPIYFHIFVDLSPGVNTYAAQVVSGPATTCPADPPPGLGTSPATPGTGFQIHDG